MLLRLGHRPGLLWQVVEGVPPEVALWLIVTVDTSILHHALISIFIALWAVITHYISILMAILSLIL